MTVTFHDTINREWCDVGGPVFDQGEARLRRPNLRKRAGNGALQPLPGSDRALDVTVAGRNDFDQIGIDEEFGTLQYDCGDTRQVRCQCMNDRRRRIRTAAQNLRERLPNQRRPVVEHHDHRAFGAGAIVVGKVE